MNDERPFIEDIRNKTADELVEMYSLIIKRAVNSKDETFVPELNGTIKNTTLRLLELGLEINNIYDKFIKENNEKRKREIIEIYDNETNEKLSECEKINQLLSSTKKEYRRSEYDAMNHRVKLFAYGDCSESSSSPVRSGRSNSEPTRNFDCVTQFPKRSKSNDDVESCDTEKEEMDTSQMQIKEEFKKGRGRPPKRGRGRPPKKHM